LGGYHNTLSCSSKSSILGGQNNTLSNNSTYSSILGGERNILSCYSNYSSIIGGFGNTMSQSNNSVIIGGQNQILNNCNDAVLVPNLIVSGSLSMGLTAGLSGTFSSGDGKVLTIINGIIISIV
jgi:hypothetical protein